MRKIFGLALADKNDSVPLWALLGEDTGADRSHVERRSAHDGAGRPHGGPEIWQVVESCGRQSAVRASTRRGGARYSSRPGHSYDTAGPTDP
jgi:hypothetical protein